MISRITALMIQGNHVMFVDTADETECWICHEPNVPHALMLSCPKDKRADLEKIVAKIKESPKE